MDKVLNLYRVDKVIKDSKIKESNEWWIWDSSEVSHCRGTYRWVMKQVSGRAALPPGHGTPVATPLPSGPGSGACFTLSKSSSNSMLGAGRRPSRFQTKKAFCGTRSMMRIFKRKRNVNILFTWRSWSEKDPSIFWESGLAKLLVFDSNTSTVSHVAPLCFVRTIPNLASRHKHIAQKQGFVGQPHEVNVWRASDAADSWKASWRSP